VSKRGITCRQCFIDNTYICQTKSKHHFFIFIYTGSVQTFTAPSATTYKLEVWGAQGGGEGTAGKGGYAMGNLSVSKSTNLYICVGGQPYNGGGEPLNDLGRHGGGATHIAITNNRGVLANYVNNKSEILLVAGGGGAAEWVGAIGGNGGGNTGGNSNYNVVLGSNSSTTIQQSIATGGTQTTGGNYGTINNSTATQIVAASFGKGGICCSGSDYGPGGGGGWYGGGGCVYVGGAGGGSGHINSDRISNGDMQSGIRQGTGYALITWMPVL